MKLKYYIVYLKEGKLYRKTIYYYTEINSFIKQNNLENYLVLQGDFIKEKGVLKNEKKS